MALKFVTENIVHWVITHIKSSAQWGNAYLTEQAQIHSFHMMLSEFVICRKSSTGNVDQCVSALAKLVTRKVIILYDTGSISILYLFISISNVYCQSFSWSVHLDPCYTLVLRI